MRVLHVIPSVGALRGGTSQAVLDMCRGLARADVEVTLATTDDNGSGCLDVSLGEPIFQDGYTVYYFPRSFRMYTVSWPLAKWLCQHIKDYDFIHVHTVFSFTPVVAALLAYCYKIPYTITPHGILLSWGVHAKNTKVKHISCRFLEKPLLNRAAFIHATSDREGKELVELKTRSPIKVIYLGIDTSQQTKMTSHTFAKDHQDAKGNIKLLFLSRIDPIKGLDLLVPAFAQALQKESRLRLVVAGDGKDTYKAWLKEMITQLGIEDHIDFCGFLRGAEKWATLEDCDIFVLPSYSESFGIAIIEVMSVGRPVIISDQVAICEAVLQAHAGLVTACSINDLTEAILNLSADSNLRRYMGLQGQRLVADRFTLSRVTEQFKNEYSHYI